MFASLRVRNYRLFASGQVVSLTGTWMQRVAQDWLVLQLSHSSGTAMGFVTGLQFLPMLLFGLYGGVLADRYPKRRLLLGTQVGMGLLALALGLLDITGAVTLWHVYLLAFLLGVATAVDVPTRQAFVVELVGKRHVYNAVSLNSATFNGARVVGPAVAGLMIKAMGTGPVFLANAVSFVAVLIGLLLIREGELHAGRPIAREPHQLRQGLSYVRRRPQLLLPIVLVGVIGTLGLNFQLTLALISKVSFHRDAASYGVLSTAFAFGSLLGALFAARRPSPRLRVLLGSALAFGVLETVAGFMPSYLALLLVLVPTGAAVLTFTTTANSSLQLGSAPSMRGRVMALYALVFLGGTPIGAPLVGWIAQTLGARWGLIVGGVSSLVATAVVSVLLVRVSQVRVEPHLLRRRPHVHLRPTESATVFDEVRSAS